MIIEFVIPTYDRTYQLHSMLASIAAQNCNNWIATVVVDDITTNTIAKNIISKFNSDKIRCIYTYQRHNDWGHTPREIGKQLSESDYIIMTGDDNYYIPSLVWEINIATRTNPGVIYWDMIHSHYNYSYFKCYPNYNQIDMGAFATRRDIAQSISLNTTYAADGEFIEDIKKKFPNEEILKIDKVLFIHN